MKSSCFLVIQLPYIYYCSIESCAFRNWYVFIHSSTLTWNLRIHERRKRGNPNILTQLTFNKDILGTVSGLLACTPDRMGGMVMSHFSWLRKPGRDLTTLKNSCWDLCLGLSVGEVYMQKSLLALALAKLEDDCLELRAQFAPHFALD